MTKARRISWRNVKTTRGIMRHAFICRSNRYGHQFVAPEARIGGSFITMCGKAVKGIMPELLATADGRCSDCHRRVVGA